MLALVWPCETLYPVVIMLEAGALDIENRVATSIVYSIECVLPISISTEIGNA
jgi:hypothetical protein